MDIMQPLPKNHPEMRAWEEYRQTGEFKNSLDWARKDGYTEGSLWVAFDEGWRAARVSDENIDLQLSRFWCGSHVREAFIVHREPRTLVLDCGCVYRVDSATGAEWINSTAPVKPK